MAKQVADKLEKEHGIKATLVNPKFVTGLDTELLDSLEANHDVVVTLEDGVLEGGYGQMVASYLGNKDLAVQTYGLSKAFHDRYNASELLEKEGITVDNIVNHVLAKL